MRKSREIIGAGICFAAIVGTAAVAASGDNVKDPQNIASSPYTPELQTLSNRIIQLAASSPGRISDQLSSLDGFRVATLDDGTLSITTQTKSEAPKAGLVETIDIRQTIAGKRAFAMLFHVTDGKWSVDCRDNLNGGNAMSEASETLAYAGDLHYADMAYADAVLGAAIYNTRAAIELVATQPTDSLLQPLGDLCAISLGDG